MLRIPFDPRCVRANIRFQGACYYVRIPNGWRHVSKGWIQRQDLLLHVSLMASGDFAQVSRPQWVRPSPWATPGCWEGAVTNAFCVIRRLGT